MLQHFGQDVVDLILKFELQAIVDLMVVAVEAKWVMVLVPVVLVNEVRPPICHEEDLEEYVSSLCDSRGIAADVLQGMIDQRSQLVAADDYRRVIDEEPFVEAKKVIEEEAQPN